MGLEELGIPGVSIVQEGFVLDAKTTGEAYKFLNPPMAVTPYIFTSLNAQQTRREVDAIIEQIINGLTNALPEPKGEVIERITTRGPKDEILEFTGKDFFECFSLMNEAFLEWGWSDGFPIMPATREAVDAMLGGTNRSPDDIIMENFVPGMAQATVKNIAINAVMAGCKPNFLPVLFAAVKAMHDLCNMRLVTISTSPHAPLFVINGPAAQILKVNSGTCSLGPAGPEKLSFSNIVIGRGVRLILMNVGNVYPGIMDQDTIGSPCKFSMVLAENEKANPWEPFHVEKGFAANDSTISCFYGDSLVEMCELESDSPEGLMSTFARHLVGLARLSGAVIWKPLILLAPDHASILKRAGWTKEDIRRYIFLHCRIPAEEYRKSACSCSGRPKWIEAANSNAMVNLYERPEDIQIIVVGGMAGKSAAFISMYNEKPIEIKLQE